MKDGLAMYAVQFVVAKTDKNYITRAALEKYINAVSKQVDSEYKDEIIEHKYLKKVAEMLGADVASVFYEYGLGDIVFINREAYRSKLLKNEYFDLFEKYPSNIDLSPIISIDSLKYLGASRDKEKNKEDINIINENQVLADMKELSKNITEEQKELEAKLTKLQYKQNIIAKGIKDTSKEDVGTSEKTK